MYYICAESAVIPHPTSQPYFVHKFHRSRSANMSWLVKWWFTLWICKCRKIS